MEQQRQCARIIDTTVGRAILSKVLPVGMPFALINRDMDKRAISSLIDECYRRTGLKDTVILADKLMYTGFNFATRAGISFCADDMVIPEEKQSILREAEKEVEGNRFAVCLRSGYQGRAIQQGHRYLVAHQ